MGWVGNEHVRGGCQELGGSGLRGEDVMSVRRTKFGCREGDEGQKGDKRARGL